MLQVVQQHAFTVGTLVEFEDKKRTRVGKITASEHKSNGGARYSVEDHDGKKFDIPDKAVHYAMKITPDNERRVAALFDEFAVALEEDPTDLEKDLEITTLSKSSVGNSIPKFIKLSVLDLKSFKSNFIFPKGKIEFTSK